FTFEGLLLASILFNVPFAVQPMQRGFEAVSRDVREAAWCSGMSRWSTFLRIELPLAWPGLLSAFVLTFAHTLGEFGVVLMVGGSIPGETRTIAIAIYDRMQAFDESAAASMAAVLLGFSLAAITLVHVLGGRVGARPGWPGGGPGSPAGAARADAAAGGTLGGPGGTRSPGRPLGKRQDHPAPLPRGALPGGWRPHHRQRRDLVRRRA